MRQVKQILSFKTDGIWDQRLRFLNICKNCSPIIVLNGINRNYLRVVLCRFIVKCQHDKKLNQVHVATVNVTIKCKKMEDNINIHSEEIDCEMMEIAKMVKFTCFLLRENSNYFCKSLETLFAENR